MARARVFWLATVGYQPDPVQTIEEQRGALESARWVVARLAEHLVKAE